AEDEHDAATGAAASARRVVGPAASAAARAEIDPLRAQASVDTSSHSAGVGAESFAAALRSGGAVTASPAAASFVSGLLSTPVAAAAVADIGGVVGSTEAEIRFALLLVVEGANIGCVGHAAGVADRLGIQGAGDGHAPAG